MRVYELAYFMIFVAVRDTIAQMELLVKFEPLPDDVIADLKNQIDTLKQTRQKAEDAIKAHEQLKNQK